MVRPLKRSSEICRAILTQNRCQRWGNAECVITARLVKDSHARSLLFVAHSHNRALENVHMAESLFNLLGTEHNWNIKGTPNTGFEWTRSRCKRRPGS